MAGETRQRYAALKTPLGLAHVFQQIALFPWNIAARRHGLPTWEDPSYETQGNEAILKFASTQPQLQDGAYTVIGVYSHYAQQGFMPVYRSAVSVTPTQAFEKCEVCGTKRARKNIILLEESTQNVKTIGYHKNCYNAFMSLPLDTPLPPLQFLLSNIEDIYIELLRDIENAPHTSTDVALGAAYYYTHTHGYLSKRAAQQRLDTPTARLMEEGIFHQQDSGLFDSALVGAVLRQELLDLKGVAEFSTLSPRLQAGVETLTSEETTRHAFNIIALIPTLYQEYLDSQKIGIYGGQPYGHYTDSHVGEVGEKIKDHTVILERVIPFAMSNGKSLFVFKDQNGRQITWFTSLKTITVGVEILLSGTIYRHNEYKGVKETRIVKGKIRRIVLPK